MNSTSRSRLQISIRTFLVVATIAILAVSHWNTSRQLQSAHVELRKLRDEAGYLTLEDRSLVHVMALESPEADAWRWRLFIPKGARYTWHIACEEIPMAAPPTLGKPWSSVSNEPYWNRDNEVLVTAKLLKNDDGNYTLSVRSKIGDSKDQMGGLAMQVPKEKLEWRSLSPSRHVHVLGKTGTETVEPDGPVILLFNRAMKRTPGGSAEIPDEPMPGFMVWMTRRK